MEDKNSQNAKRFYQKIWTPEAKINRHTESRLKKHIGNMQKRMGAKSAEIILAKDSYHDGNWRRSYQVKYK